MKISRSLQGWITLAALLALPADHAAAIVFTTNTHLTVTNADFDGQDVIVSNCVLTVDGPHAFNSLRVATGATLTHAASAAGTIFFPAHMTNEPYQLVDTTTVTLTGYAAEFASVEVTDTNSLVTYTRDVDYELINTGVITLARTTNSAIAGGDIVFVSYDFLAATNTGLNLILTNDFELEPGASVNLTGRGFGGNTGVGNGGETGSPLSGAGAGYGGGGGNSSSNAVGGVCYGLFNQPFSLGSGGGLGVGGAGGPGGGLLKLVVGQNAIINGAIGANGAAATNSRSGGGSGGSVWIAAQTISGTGSITAHGGTGEPIHGGGGGGGRIAVQFDTNNFTGSLATYGGTGWRIGGAGTIYTKPTSQTGLVLVDNGGLPGTNSVLALAETADVVIRGNALVTASGSWSARDVTVVSNSLIFTPGPGAVTLTARDVIVQAGAGLLADRAGSSSQQGTGPGVSLLSSGFGYLGSGGGHGGYGGSSSNNAPGGSFYGSLTAPLTSGSGGGGLNGISSSPGGFGGGAIRVSASRLLQVDGRISVDGGSGASANGGGSGGGSGGSVWLASTYFSGSGSITANGGNGAGGLGGGGGGGRIVVTFSSNLFTGTITAYGGGGANVGGAGTLLIRTNAAGVDHVILDNGGRTGTNTPVSLNSAQDLVVSDGAKGELLYGGSGLHHLWIKTNGTLVASKYYYSPGQVNLTIYGNVVIDAGGLLSLSGMGYSAGSGTGAGYTYVNGPKGGAGHGGFGALNGNGGGAYGSFLFPASSGSGGGNGSGTTGAGPYGGAGGGALRLMFNGQNNIMIVNGTLAADGLGGQLNSGGGSGGSLWLSPVTLKGSGKITANGGDGNGTAGGAGGGRISISYTSNLFTGQITAYGGNGTVAGGAGTIYLVRNNTPAGQLFLDNGGLAGTNTPLSITFGLPAARYNLTIGGAANALVLTAQQLSNLTINAGSGLTIRSNETNLSLDVSRDVTIAAGGAINVDGKGFGRAAGTGAGTSLASKGAGAGHGGLGGNAASGAGGGTNYGSPTQPVNRGSGGGAGAYSYFGGCDGGGVIRLIVGGTLNVGGSLSANGNAGLQDDSGGGAGGSIWMTAGTLTGGGNIFAKGGDGDFFGGGGGGGGRIAIYSLTNNFSGLLSTAGGAGANAGRTGTVFFSTNLTPLIAITGTITNLAGQPMAGVVLHPASNVQIADAVSGSNGGYLLAVPAGWYGTVTPSLGTNQFVPQRGNYFAVTTPITGQNFLMVPTVGPMLVGTSSGTSLVLKWNGFPGLLYWVEDSTNLVDWTTVAGHFYGSDGAIQVLTSFDASPARFFRVRTSY